MSNLKHILFIYAHLDDETILSYGTISKLKKSGHNVHVCCLCGNGRKDSDNVIRQNAFLNNIKELDVSYNVFDNKDLTLNSDIVNTYIREVFSFYKNIDTVFTHSLCDNHFEHKLLAEQILLKCRKTKDSNINSLYTSVMPNSAWTYNQFGNFTPNYFVDISDVIEQKKIALNRYITELIFDSNDLRSTDAIIDQNRLYGRQMNVNYCEAYQQIFSFVQY